MKCEHLLLLFFFYVMHFDIPTKLVSTTYRLFNSRLTLSKSCVGFVFTSYLLCFGVDVMNKCMLNNVRRVAVKLLNRYMTNILSN